MFLCVDQMHKKIKFHNLKKPSAINELKYSQSNELQNNKSILCKGEAVQNICNFSCRDGHHFLRQKNKREIKLTQNWMKVHLGTNVCYLYI